MTNCIYIAGNFLSRKVGVRGAGEDLAEQLRLIGWNTITASSYPNRIIRLIDLLWTTLFQAKRYQVALVEVYSDLAFLWAEIVCIFLRILKKPYILTLHGGKLYQFAKKNQQRVRKLLTSAYTVTTPSRFLFDTFKDIRPDLNFLPNAIELGKYSYVLRETVSPNLIWLRSFHEIYNPVLAIETLIKVASDFPEIKLTMIGPDKKDGSLSEVLKRAQELNLSDKVYITGAIPKKDVSQFINRGDIFINTTNYESFGVSVLEAAACGLPIVTTNVGELSYLWKNDVDALLVAPNDPNAMADAVKRLLIEPGLANKLSQNARKKAELFDWSKILPQWDMVLKKIISHG
ncbi:MAG: glycosyltransferase family 4 protein [Anaerolineaceae bacterium]|nr:glycosyltransferase family 4 protein [Anaerolineaceae bacterium]